MKNKLNDDIVKLKNIEILLGEHIIKLMAISNKIVERQSRIDEMQGEITEAVIKHLGEQKVDDEKADYFG